MCNAVVDRLTCGHQLSEEVLSICIFIGNLVRGGILDVVMPQTQIEYKKDKVSTKIE